MQVKKKFLFLFFTFFAVLSSFAEGREEGAEMADVMRQSGKIYVVVAVLALIFVGIVVYLYTIDRKVTKLEKKLGKNS